MRPLAGPVLCLTVASGCAFTGGPPPLLGRDLRSPEAKVQLTQAATRVIPDEAVPDGDPRTIVVQKARALLDGAPLTSRGYRFSPDPVGFAQAAFWSAGIDLVSPRVAADETAHGTELLYRSAALRGELHQDHPGSGDLIFFANPEQGAGEAPGQVAVVEEVRGDGTLTAIGSFAGGPARVLLSLKRDEGARRHKTHSAAVAGSDQLSLARLVRGFASPY